MSCHAETAENPDLSHPIVMASGTKPLVKVRYAAGTLKHVAILALARAPSTRKRLFWFGMAVFSHKRLFLKILAVFHANLACGHFFAYTEGPGRA